MITLSKKLKQQSQAKKDAAEAEIPRRVSVRDKLLVKGEGSHIMLSQLLPSKAGSTHQNNKKSEGPGQ